MQTTLLGSLSNDDNNELDPQLWAGSFNGKESSLHQLAPYVGKLKSGMVRVLICKYTKPGDTVLDPFCGSGVVPLECILTGRHAVANDLSPYAYVVTRGKLSAPRSKAEALRRATMLSGEAEARSKYMDLTIVPDWVRRFFHPNTLSEILAAVEILKEWEDDFLLACLLGILHHVRPGFLSYPASHLTPYLRTRKYPPEQFPAMYAYRDLRSRLLAKVARAYRRSLFSDTMNTVRWQVFQRNAMSLPLESESIDAVISSPPYFGALDYARDNRLRLWFLGVSSWKELDRALTANDSVYLPQMNACLSEMFRVLKRGGRCVLVLGDVERNGKSRPTAEIISELALEATGGQLQTKGIWTDEVPDIRRSRRATKTTKYERIVYMEKA
ncbi:MAG: site-specific DNA-methyltransferase [Chloroflexi bacterium]|nr:site-specific DNA-methyltransferase [Chloroflexota bacterium]